MKHVYKLVIVRTEQYPPITVVNLLFSSELSDENHADVYRDSKTRYSVTVEKVSVHD